ncbi:hypothetical protein BCR43DRAFT_254017 [Syncephalastrum racemosum]|uniref:Uncharacterized protein n=1 Tax=Syncephalastrum racemosum TaxID=13706 RepID=A0A1X2HG07_SYNRA|nr:hypothetical protein BCR43DRAFT_254017 [Syncephalastrum racemosum]
MNSVSTINERSECQGYPLFAGHIPVGYGFLDRASCTPHLPSPGSGVRSRALPLAALAPRTHEKGPERLHHDGTGSGQYPPPYPEIVPLVLADLPFAHSATEVHHASACVDSLYLDAQCILVVRGESSTPCILAILNEKKPSLGRVRRFKQLIRNIDSWWNS